MDEAYASPDSDGHASLPSPTDSTFDLSQLPLKRRGRESIMISSSFVHPPSTADSSDDESTFHPTQLHNRMLQTSPLLSSAAKPPANNNILTPIKNNHDDNTPRPSPRTTPRTTPRRLIRGPRKPTMSPAHTENIDPQESNASPPKLTVQKPEFRASDEEEDALVDNTTPITPDTAVADTPTPDKRAKHRAQPPSPQLHSSPQLPKPLVEDKAHLIPGTPQLRYLNWISSDDADDEDAEKVPLRHEERSRKAQAQRIVDETAFLGGDEASVLLETSVGEEMLDMFHRGGPEKGGEGDVGEDSDVDDTRLTTLSEVETPVVSRRGSRDEGDAGKEMADRAENLESTDGANDEGENENTQHSSDDRPEVLQQPTPEPESSAVQGSKPEPPAPDTAATNANTSSIIALADAASSTGSSKTITPTPHSTTSPQNTDTTTISNGNPTPRQSFTTSTTPLPQPSPNPANTTTAESPSANLTTLYSPAFVAHSTPKDFYDLWALKNSSRGRRVSMNTPPSTFGRSLSGTEILDNPPEFSSLGSGFSFPSRPVRYEVWDPESVSREFTPPFPVEGVGVRRGGYEAPVNTPWKEGKGRARSKSDPVGKKMGGVGLKGLFTPGRVVRRVLEEREADGDGERCNDVEEREADELDDEEALVDELDISDTDDDGNDGRHWSGFTHDFQSSFARLHKSPSTAPISQSSPSQDRSNRSIGPIDFRMQTPASIGESKDDGSNNTLWLRMAQAEAENDRFRKLLDSNNIKIEDQESSSGNLTVTANDTRDVSSSRESDYNTDDPGALRRRVAELEVLVEVLGRREAELKGESERREMLAEHWQTQYNDVRNLALQNRENALSLERQVKELEQQAAVESINHDREINEVVSKMRGEKQHNRQKSVGLEDRVKYFENRVDEARRDAEEKERTISHLRQALSDRRQSAGGVADQHLVAELEEKLQATEDKYTNLLSEKEGLVRHLQAELDEMVNLMPVDHGSSRMIDEEEAEDWLDEKSREITQYYDDGLDQIITELHWNGEKEDFEEAVEEAEMSLRRTADEAGLDEPLDKATLAAFGIRQLRTEHELLKTMLIGSEGRVKELLQANDELSRQGADTEEKLAGTEDERDAFRAAANEAEAAGTMLADQVDALRAKLQEGEKHIKQLVNEHDALSQRCAEVEEQMEGLEADKVALQRLVNDTKRLNDMLKSQAAETEKRSKGFEEEIAGLRRQLQEEKDHVEVVETETMKFRQQLTEWEETASTVGKQRDGFAAQLKEKEERVKVIEKEKEELSKKLMEAVKGQVQSDSKEAESLKKQVKELQERIKALVDQHNVTTATITQLEEKIAHSDDAAQRLTAEKEFLKAELGVAANESKAARGRFVQLLHDTAEKEAKWASVMERSVTGESEPKGTVEAYRKSLALIVQEIEKETPAFADDEEKEEVDIEGVQDPELVRIVIRAFRWRDRRLAESEERNKRYKAAAKKWMKENDKKRSRVEELVAEVRELGLRLKAEKKSSDEKLGQLILALRRGE